MRASFALPLVSLVSLVGALSGGCRGPDPTTPKQVAVPPGVVRYVVGGDSRNDWAEVVPWAFREARARGATAFLFLGDMELTPQLDGHFADELPLLGPVPFYPVLGNHEIKLFGALALGQASAARSFRRRFLSTARTPVHSVLEDRVVYSVDLPGGLHFVALDNVSQPGFGALQLAWLASDLEAARSDGTPRRIVIGMHKPLANNGVSTHGMDGDGPLALADTAAALAIFEKAKVDLILASHVHEYALFEQNGITSYITGGLGAPLVSTGKEHAFHHFLVLDVSEKGIAVGVVRHEGAASISKGDDDDD